MVMYSSKLYLRDEKLKFNKLARQQTSKSPNEKFTCLQIQARAEGK